MTEPTSLSPKARTYRGSCRCGAYRFEADLDLSEGTLRCNCTVCTKLGWWAFSTAPATFRLLAGDDVAPPEVGAAFARCEACGVAPFTHGNVPELGGEYYSVNVRCLDDVDLSGVPIHYLDGRHDTWALLAEGVYQDPFVGGGSPADG